MKNFTDLTGKKAIVTGAAQGLCHGMAEGLMEAGAEVCIIDINPKTLDTAAEFTGRGFTCHGVIADLGDDESLKEGFHHVVEALGGHLDIIVNGAGVQKRHLSEEFPIDEDAFDAFGDEMLSYGRKAAVIYGEKAWAASKDYIVPALKKAGIEMVCGMLYGHDATCENVERIAANPKVQEADLLIAVGGGKCIDTVKLAADQMGKPVFTVPSIASNCAPVTKISIMYHEDGSFRYIPRLKKVPVHCFINPRIVLAAPVRYLWAGVGDAVAKNVESEWSARAGERLNYGSELGIMAGRLCFDPLIRDGRQVLRDAAEGQNSEALEQTILNVVVTPGITSVSVDPEYNGGVAHALFYGLTSRRHIEKNHLHGEVVSYGSLVNLMLDVMHGGSAERLNTAYLFNESVKLPVCLADLELEITDPLSDVLEVTMANQELVHTPYPVSKELIHQAMLNLDSYQAIR